MIMRCPLALAAILMIVISLGLQAYDLFLVFFELWALGNVGFASMLGYGASLTFSIPSYIVANALIYGAKIKLPMKWIHLSYFGSHLLILILTFAFPGKFGQ
jgi:hypothetical protein